MSATSRFASTAAVLLGLLAASPARPFAQRLPTYSIRPDHIFIAGISSGGYMAVQMEVAYSALFRGAAVYDAGPDGCAQGDLATALSTCEGDSPPIPLNALEGAAENWARRGLIDPLDNLRGHSVYLWSGRLDSEVMPPVVDKLRAFYVYFGADVFRYDNGFPAEHGWESPLGPVPCSRKESPYIIACKASEAIRPSGERDSGAPAAGAGNYDSEVVWLTRWFGQLNPKNTGKLRGSVVAFDQNVFAPNRDAGAISMDATGYAFVPADCAAARACGLVLALHGCLQYHGRIGMTFIADAGINEWADTNSIVVLYPQTTTYPATLFNFGNPLGCWDWWGYLNDPDYAVKTGPQMQALYNMVVQAAGLRSQAPSGQAPGSR